MQNATSIYSNIIDEVITNLRQELGERGVTEDVINELRIGWMNRLNNMLPDSSLGMPPQQQPQQHHPYHHPIHYQQPPPSMAKYPPPPPPHPHPGNTMPPTADNTAAAYSSYMQPNYPAYAPQQPPTIPPRSHMAGGREGGGLAYPQPPSSHPHQHQHQHQHQQPSLSSSSSSPSSLSQQQQQPQQQSIASISNLTHDTSLNSNSSSEFDSSPSFPPNASWPTSQLQQQKSQFPTANTPNTPTGHPHNLLGSEISPISSQELSSHHPSQQQQQQQQQLSTQPPTQSQPYPLNLPSPNISPSISEKKEEEEEKSNPIQNNNNNNNNNNNYSNTEEPPTKRQRLSQDISQVDGAGDGDASEYSMTEIERLKQGMEEFDEDDDEDDDEEGDDEQGEREKGETQEHQYSSATQQQGHHTNQAEQPPPSEELEGEEEPLNSDDDISDSAEDMPETDNLVLSQYEKVTRHKNKWKCVLRHGWMHLNQRDYFFNKATGEFEW